MLRSTVAIVAAILVTPVVGRQPSVALGALPAQGAAAPAARAQTPEQFFGFRIGTDGELARYPRDRRVPPAPREARRQRVRFEELGKTTMGNRVRAGDDQLAGEPREAAGSSRSTAGWPTRAASRRPRRRRSRRRAAPSTSSTHDSLDRSRQRPGDHRSIAHRLATDDGADVRQILDNVVVLLVPSQNPDGQVLVIDHWYKTKGTPFARVYPDLYHKYVGHDDNRDWFMFTQKETRLAVEVQNRYKPIITHDMHQMGRGGARIFVPPYDDPYDPNIHPILAQGMATVGETMATALRVGREGWRRVPAQATTCGRPRGSTWCTTARRAS